MDVCLTIPPNSSIIFNVQFRCYAQFFQLSIMSRLTIHEALRLAPEQVYSTGPTRSSLPPNSRVRYPTLFPTQYVPRRETWLTAYTWSTQMPRRKPVPSRGNYQLAASIRQETHPALLMDQTTDIRSRLQDVQTMSTGSAREAFDCPSDASSNSQHSSDESFHRMLSEFPKPPVVSTLPIVTSGDADLVGDLQSRTWAKKSQSGGSATFESHRMAPLLEREVLISPKNIHEFNKATNNISVVNRRATKRNSGPVRTFFHDASISSPTLRPNRWSMPDNTEASKRESTLNKVKVAAKRSAHKVNCFSSDDEEDDTRHRQGSDSTISTIVSSIAEITDAMSQARWRLYFAKVEERRRVRNASWVNVGGRM